ncbi:MAG: hypothetical protein U0451_03355 [Candidatus Saccharimonadales bacterium]
MKRENPEPQRSIEQDVPMLDIGGLTLVGTLAVNAYKEQGGHGIVRHPVGVEGTTVDEAPLYPSDTSSPSNPNY